MREYDPSPVLDVSHLSISFGVGPAIVQGVDIRIDAGEIVCLVGASGSGKSLTGLALMGLTPPSARVRADRWLFEGVSLLQATRAERQKLRGGRMGLVFQDPALALNPLITIGGQIVEALRAHQAVSAAAARRRALEMLDRVRLPGSAERLDLYPHQLSGGMRQRALIAMALICRPRLLIADEPTSALDVVVEREIIDLVDEFRRETGAATLLITHNLALVAEIADQILVMHAGTIVERGSCAAILTDPLHPYTLALVAAASGSPPLGEPLAIVPKADALLTEGCRYLMRCSLSTAICAKQRPRLSKAGASHEVACWRAPIETSME